MRFSSSTKGPDMNNFTSDVPSEGGLIVALRDGQRDLQQEVRQLERKVQEAQRELERARRKLAHVEGFLNLEEDKPHEIEPTDSQSPSKDVVCDAVEQILRGNNGEPMHYRVLEAELRQRGTVILGKNPANGLVSRIHKDRRFVRPTRRGFYALREDYPDAVSIGERKGRRDSGEGNRGSNE